MSLDIRYLRRALCEVNIALIVQLRVNIDLDVVAAAGAVYGYGILASVENNALIHENIIVIRSLYGLRSAARIFGKRYGYIRLGRSCNACADGNPYLRSLGHFLALGIALFDDSTLGLIAVLLVYCIIENKVERFKYSLCVLDVLIYKLGNLDKLLFARIINRYCRALRHLSAVFRRGAKNSTRLFRALLRNGIDLKARILELGYSVVELVLENIRNRCFFLADCDGDSDNIVGLVNLCARRRILRIDLTGLVEAVLDFIDFDNKVLIIVVAENFLGIVFIYKLRYGKLSVENIRE